MKSVGIKFVPHGKGLHDLDLSKYGNAEAMMVSTVRGNYEGFTKNNADAHRLQGMIESPAMRKFEGMIHGSMTINSLITIEDITNAYKISKPGLTGVCGKTGKKNIPCHYGICFYTK